MVLVLLVTACQARPAGAQVTAQPEAAAGALSTLPARGLAAAIAEASSIEVPAVDPSEVIAIRAAQASVPEQRAFSVTYVRSRFYERQVDSNGNKLAEVLTEGWDELERFVSMLSLKGRVTDDGAARLVSRSAVKTPGPPAADAREAQGALLADTWNENAVSEWLRDLGLDVHVSAFADARIDGRLLLKLDDEDLLELGVTSKLQRKLILSRCEALREGKR
jgi:hypothetical protein